VQFTNDYLSEILLGALFLVVILLLPRGVIPTIGEQVTAWQARRAGQAGGVPAPEPAAAAAAASGPASGGGAAAAGRRGKDSAR
jgi:hypothetical protein